jgi:serine/threonine protein kinase
MPNFTKESILKEVYIASPIPAKVAFSDIENGRLLSNQLVVAIEEKIATGAISLPESGKARISKKQLQAFGISSPYGAVVLKNNNNLRIFIRYKGEKYGRHLGKGAFGKVKILWEPKTNQYFAFKQQKYANDLGSEIEMLHRAGQLVDSFTYPTSKKWLEKYGHTTSAMIMQIAPGKTLTDIYSQGLNAAEVMQMCVNVADAFSPLHTQNIVHCDIKPPNLHYDLSSQTATVIDLGTAVNTGITTNLRGTPPFMPKALRNLVFAITNSQNKILAYEKSIHAITIKLAEIDNDIKKLEKNITDVKANGFSTESLEAELSDLSNQQTTLQTKKQQQQDEVKILKQQYTENASRFSMAEHTVQGDIHSLGLTYAMKLELIAAVPTKGENAQHYAIYAGSPRSQEPLKNYPEQRTAVIQFLSRMTSDDPSQIPSLHEVRAFFSTVQQQLRDLPENKIDVGLLDVQEFTRANFHEKLELLKALENNSKVQLIAANGAFDESEFKLVRKQIEEYGLTVNAKVLTSAAPLAELIAAIPTYARSSVLNQRFSLITRQALTHNKVEQFDDIRIIKPTPIAPLTPPSYLPPQMDPADLGIYGRLITPKTVNDIRKKLQAGDIKIPADQDAVKISKKDLKRIGIDSSYSIVVTKSDRIFAIYKGAKKGKTLGKGSFGQLKLVQDQETGTLYAEKTSNLSLETEAGNLKKVGKLETSFSYSPKADAGKKKYTPPKGEPLAHAIIMELAQGIPLTSPKIASLSIEQQLELCINLAKAVAELHKNNIVHTDLKPENLFFNPANNKITIIDFGSALANNTRMVPQGSLAFAPSESQQAVNKGEPMIYTEKFDVYSTGIIMGIVTKLAKEIIANNKLVGYEIAAQVDSDKTVLIKLQQLLIQATQPDADKRPNMAVIVQNLIALQQIKQQKQAPNTAEIMRTLARHANVSSKQATAELLRHKPTESSPNKFPSKEVSTEKLPEKEEKTNIETPRLGRR